MDNKLLNKCNAEDLKIAIKNYYGYTDNQLKEHWSKWKEVELLQQQIMINHDDINDLITDSYKDSYQPLNIEQKTIQTKEFLKIIDILIEPILPISKKMKY